MRIDGKIIAQELCAEIKHAVAALSKPPRLTILIPQETFVIRKFVDIKKAFALEAGIECTEVVLNPLQNESDLIHEIMHAGQAADGVIVQLPLPPRMNLETILSIIPASLDIDVMGATAYAEFMNGRLPLMPPVAGAVAEILERTGHRVAGRNVVIVGEGRLVGAPVAAWATRMGGHVTVVTQRRGSLLEALRDADIVISGTGVPGIITPEMIHPGMVLIDAGTSESAGKLVGDIDPRCEAEAAVFTPTPGGVGPITVAMVFKNLLKLLRLRSGEPVEQIEQESLS
jgi:methylenetetrahydrofolate dehydrogenase (NADP+)/methenyltetrahydrofolate cyclohydrolase